MSWPFTNNILSNFFLVSLFSIQNEDDFVGYERIDDDFHPRFQPKSSHLTDTSVSKDCHVERDKQKVDVSWTSPPNNSSLWKSSKQKHVKDGLLPETFASQVPSWSAAIPPSQPSVQLNGAEGRNQESNKKLSATTFQPVKSVFTPKPTVPSKKFMDKKNSSLKLKKPSDESDSVCRKPRSDLPKRPPALALVEEHFDHGTFFSKLKSNRLFLIDLEFVLLLSNRENADEKGD